MYSITIFNCFQIIIEEQDIHSEDNPDAEATYKPWPHLHKFVSYIRTEGEICILSCKTCLPKKHEIRVHKSSNSNIKSHFRKIHPAQYTELEETCKAASKRGKKRSLSSDGSEQMDTKQSRQLSLAESFGISAAGAGVSQAAVDKSISDLIIYGMYPLQMVDCIWFRSYSKVLNPNRLIPSRRTIGRRIIDSYKEGKELLIQ